MTRPAQARGFNIDDLGYFASLKSSVWREGIGTVEGMVGGIKRLVEYGRHRRRGVPEGAEMVRQ